MSSEPDEHVGLLAHLRLAPTRDADDAHLLSWTKALEAFGKEACVRAAVAAARVALEVWERVEPALRAPHERIAAAEAWLACPCDEHASAAGELAWANGDDNPLKWTTLVVEGKHIEDDHAIYAHWASDNAASAAWCPSTDLAAQVCGTGASAAVAALAASDLPLPELRARVVDAIVAALTPRAPLESGDPRELALLRALEEHPSDRATRIVYSDWLEEAGRMDEAALLRVELALAALHDSDARRGESLRRLHALEHLVHPAWLRVVRRR